MLTHFHQHWWQSGSGHIISGNAGVGPDPGHVLLKEGADTAKPGLHLPISHDIYNKYPSLFSWW